MRRTFCSMDVKVDKSLLIMMDESRDQVGTRYGPGTYQVRTRYVPGVYLVHEPGP